MHTKKEDSPSILGVYFYAILMALSGGLLGFVFMMRFPAQAFSSQEEYAASIAELEEPIPASKPGDAYYVEGPVLRNRTWETKRAQLATEGAQAVRFSAGEINAWMTAKFRPGVAPTGSDEPSVLIVPGVPNVAITSGATLYFNLPTTISIFGTSNDYTVSARCQFEGASVQLKTIQISSAKLPLPSIIGAKLLKTLFRGYQGSEEFALLAEAFTRAESIEVTGDELVFQLR